MLEIIVFLIAVSDQSHWALKTRLGFIPLSYLQEENFSSEDFGVSIGFAYRSSFRWIYDIKAQSQGIFPEYIELCVPYKKTSTNFTVFWRKFYFFGLKYSYDLWDSPAGSIYDSLEEKTTASLYSYGIKIKQLLKRKFGLSLSLSKVSGNIDEQAKTFVSQKSAYAITPLSGWGIEGEFFILFKDMHIKFTGNFLSKISGITKPGGDTIIVNFLDPLPSAIYFLPDTIENEMPYKVGMEIQKKFNRISGLFGLYYEGWRKVDIYYFRNAFVVSAGAKLQISSKISSSLYLTYLWNYRSWMREQGFIISSRFDWDICKDISMRFNISGQKPYLVYNPSFDPGIRYEVRLGITAKR